MRSNFEILLDAQEASHSALRSNPETVNHDHGGPGRATSSTACQVQFRP